MSKLRDGLYRQYLLPIPCMFHDIVTCSNQNKKEYQTPLMADNDTDEILIY